MKSLLRLKAWVLFMFFILPLFLEIITLIAVGFSMVATGGFEQDEALVGTVVMAGLTVLSAIVGAVILFSWIYAVATRLYPKLPAVHTMKLGRFKFAFFFPMIYVVVFMCFMFFVFPSVAPEWAFIIVPFHFLAIACIFYVLYFTAKSLKTFELNRNVTFGDYAGEFFLLWFYFIGVWFIQPRINAIFGGEETSEYGGPVDRYLK